MIQEGDSRLCDVDFTLVGEKRNKDVLDVEDGKTIEGEMVTEEVNCYHSS